MQARSHPRPNRGLPGTLMRLGTARGVRDATIEVGILARSEIGTCKPTSLPPTSRVPHTRKISLPSQVSRGEEGRGQQQAPLRKRRNRLQGRSRQNSAGPRAWTKWGRRSSEKNVHRQMLFCKRREAVGFTVAASLRPTESCHPTTEAGSFQKG